MYPLSYTIFIVKNPSIVFDLFKKTPNILLIVPRNSAGTTQGPRTSVLTDLFEAWSGAPYGLFLPDKDTLGFDEATGCLACKYTEILVKMGLVGIIQGIGHVAQLRIASRSYPFKGLIETADPDIEYGGDPDGLFESALELPIRYAKVFQ